MARVTRVGNATSLGLPGRNAFELVSGQTGARSVTCRLVEIPVSRGEQEVRKPHFHESFEECIYLLSGEGTTIVDGVDHPLEAGDTILIAPGERHMTRNTGNEPLVLLCFFPVADITTGTHEPGTGGRDGKQDRDAT